MNDCPYGDKVHWLSEESYEKAKGQLRLQLQGVFEPFDMYGQGIYIRMAVEEVLKLSEDFGLRIRGIDKAIDIDHVRTKIKRGEYR